MSVFHGYSKVERIEKEECDGILQGECYVFEKLDGANAQVYLDKESGRVACGSRNRVLAIGDNVISGDNFRGFVQYVKERESKLLNFFELYPDITIFGEWLVPHKIKYSSGYYNNFYAFDFYNSSLGRYHSVYEISNSQMADIGLLYIPLDCVVKNPTMEGLKELLKLPSFFGAPFREGIVIKNYDFVNKFGRQPYGKLLHESFIEVKSVKKVIDPMAIEIDITDRYVTLARVEKICNKIQILQVDKDIGIDFQADPPKENILALANRLEMKNIPQVINMVWYDIITEDMNDILKKFKDPTINFKLLKRLAFDRAKEYFVKILQDGVVNA